MNKDVLEDKIFTKTAFAVRIDTLEAGIKYERELRENVQNQLTEMGSQFHFLSKTLHGLTMVTDGDAKNFWDIFLKYMPSDFVEKYSNPSTAVTTAIIQSLRAYGISKIGDKNGGKK